MHEYFERTCDRLPLSVAVECDGVPLTYAELDARANQLARFLRERGVGAGARVGIILPRSLWTYIALLAVGKACATFVPIDPGAPFDRVAWVCADAGVELLLTTSRLGLSQDVLPGVDDRVVELDGVAELVRGCSTTRPVAMEPPGDPAAYVMYTSGSSGRPKGVAIGQPSICNFLEVVASIYDVRPDDRVHQGMTISFDFSIEEIWPTWAVGATVVAGLSDSGSLGAELAEFLSSQAITVLYCVPTLLATIPHDLPMVRTILVGGEACPQQLVERWARPGRRMLNTYGPTEATVTATWTELRPGRPVTIGRPLPTYVVILLDENARVVGDGAVGEICIGGPGVALGYVGNPELTAQRFVPHELAPSGERLYRTGDLGRTTEHGEIEYLGRADAEVKIRGHRVDLGEIDNVLLEDSSVREAVAAMTTPPDTGGAPADGDIVELAAYVVVAPCSGETEQGHITRLLARLRERLPGYMVPRYLEMLPELPTMPSGKVDRTSLPPPTGSRLTNQNMEIVAPESDLEAELRDQWASVFGLEPATLSVDADFFHDLGGHSLLAARLVTALRGREPTAATTLRHVYTHPSVRRLAAALSAPRPGPAAPDSAPPPSAPGGATERPALRHRRGTIVKAGVFQAAVIYLVVLLLTVPLSYAITHRGGGLTSVPVIALPTYLIVRWLVVPVLCRLLAVGLRPGRYPLWGATYLRVWTLNLLTSVGPQGTLRGSPFIGAYLRLLGARVGPRTTIATGSITLPSLLRIGPDSSVGYGALLHPWRVEHGWLVIAPIEIGHDAYVGTRAVLEAGCRIGAHAGLGEQSLLGADQAIPPHSQWTGSPAAPTATPGEPWEAMADRARPQQSWSPAQLGLAAIGLTGLEAAGFAILLPAGLLLWWVAGHWGAGAGLAVTAVVAGPLYVVSVCALVAAAKRLILPSTPVGIFPARSVLGLRKWLSDQLQQRSLELTNTLYATLYTPGWLRLLGARIGHGTEVSTTAHIDPDLLDIEDGSFIADMASVGAAAFAHGHLALLPTRIGRRAFVGNAAVVPPGSKLGSGSLTGVATLAPEEQAAPDTSWLGSPAFRLPVRQSSGTFTEEQTFRPPRRLVRHRLAVEFLRATLPATLMASATYLYALVLVKLAIVTDPSVVTVLAPAAAMSAGLLVIGLCATLKWLIIGRYRIRTEPLWSPFVRYTELVTGLYEAAAVPAGLAMLTGTPFLPPLLRLFGVRIGRRTWIATTYLTEFDLVQIGDHAAVGHQASLQTHLFEDRIMKISHVRLADGASVGARTVVLYDSIVGADASLRALSLLMKGEELASTTRWRGIPAQAT